MKLRSPIAPKKARIEIIPLIDIMFFLLACFMLVSLSMVQMRGMKVALPTAATATPENTTDFHAITIDALGNLFLEKDALPSKEALVEQAKALVLANPEARFYIRADQNATHGEVVGVLDRLKQAGIARVAFEIKAQSVPAPTSNAVPATPASGGSAAPNLPSPTSPAMPAVAEPAPKPAANSAPSAESAPAAAP